ncbi:poly(U)-specific endoribonuclease-A-like [Gigantopelta aegis]|uniref:poly(U)-specific endoribonuclease-A-like n=1 Tax=Gigantopelta aegis TaxID=1735272 RepID=UPI001B88D6E5|nr:poly(U)-specific endoribonuclease-A-like [Gigantopelta aegis]
METPVFVALLLLGLVSIGHCFIDIDLCLGRCGSHVDHSKSCQCNHACTRYHDCCTDYHNTCSGGSHSVTTNNPGTFKPVQIQNVDINSLTMATIADTLWGVDTDRFQTGEITLNYGSKTHSGSHSDVSNQPLFASVNEARLQRPVYKAFLALLDNYNPSRGVADPVSANEQIEINHFLDLIMATDVMKITMQFLHKMGHFNGDEAAFRHTIERLWFRPYGRNPHGASDSSAFEHIFVGEFKGSSVGGFHSWLRFYLEEKSGNINYLGYMKRHDPLLIEFTFKWRNHFKKIDSFLVGDSPEFTMALDTICVLVHPGHLCHLKLANTAFSIQTWDVTYMAGTQIASAYTIL